MDPPLRTETIFSPVYSSGQATQVYKSSSRMCIAPQSEPFMTKSSFQKQIQFTYLKVMFNFCCILKVRNSGNFFLNLFYSCLRKPLLPTLPESSILGKTRMNCVATFNTCHHAVLKDGIIYCNCFYYLHSYSTHIQALCIFLFVF